MEDIRIKKRAVLRLRKNLGKSYTPQNKKVIEAKNDVR